MKSPLLCVSLSLLSVLHPLLGETPKPPIDLTDANSIYQYFVPSTDPKSRRELGAYLWIPPGTPKIRAVMIGAHNGLPMQILQHPAIRAVCRKDGIAQILLTPHAPDIGGVMLKGLRYDVTDTNATAVYDHYIQALADVSEHPELVKAPIVPLAHSAYMSFPFEAAVRNPAQCLAIIPIKAGTPNVYDTFATNGPALHPNPDLCLRNVPILILDSAAQETVVSRWKTQPYPQIFEPNFISSYRRDHQDNKGDTYEPQNELCGACWDMISGHFDLFQRDYQFVADWLAVIAKDRLPEKLGDPLKNLTLKDGWLMDPRVPTTVAIPTEYAMPAPYLDYKGDRSKALWFPTEELAHRLYDLERHEYTHQVELFTLLNPKGEPVSLAETPMANMPSPGDLLKDDGQFTLTTWHYTTPPQICTNTEKGHDKNTNAVHTLGNPLFPGKTTLSLSKLPLHFDLNGAALQLLRQEEFIDQRGVTEARFFLRLKPHRLDPLGSGLMFPRVNHEGNEQFSGTGRTVELSWNIKNAKDAVDQKITFPPIADASLSSKRIELKATSSAGIPVNYFVQNGPGIIQDGSFIPMDLPMGVTKPIEVTVAATQVGVYKNSGGVKSAKTVYQTFHLIP